MADSKKRRRASGQKERTYGSMAYKLDYYSDVVAVPTPKLVPAPRTNQDAVPLPKTDPQVTRRVLERSRVRVTTREQQAVAPFAIVGFLAAAAIAIALLMGYIQLNAVYADTVQLRTQLAQLESENVDLNAQFELKYDQAKLEAAVAADGTLTRAGSDQTVYIDLSEPDNAVVYGTDGENSEASGVWGTVKNWISTAVEFFR